MTKHDPRLDRLFHALSDPTRRGIVERLAHGPATVSELAEPTGMALPTVMRHIAVLAEGGLVRTEKAGRARLCHAVPDPMEAARAWMETQRRVWDARLDRMEAHVLKEESKDD